MDQAPRNDGPPAFFWIIVGLALVIVTLVIFVAVFVPFNVVNVIK